jgi:endoglucanase
MDEIGFMVKQITEQGFVKFTMLGGWVHQNLPSQRVFIRTSKGDVPGVIGSKPVHLMSEEEKGKIPDKKTLYIDIGAKDKKAVEQLGVRPGDPIIPEAVFHPMKDPNYLMAKAWDDRAGCAVFISVLKALKKREHPNTVYGVGTVQEELGMRGARTAVNLVNPDIAFICETGPAQDTPGNETPPLVMLGKGPKINLYDRGMIPHLKLRDFVIEAAQRAKIPCQLDVSEQSINDGAYIHLHAAGVPTIYIGVPARYIHSTAGIIYKPDFDNTVRLLTEVTLRLDDKTVRAFSKP